MIGGLGVGVGRNLTGLAISGIGIGSGGTLHGLAIAGLGIGAPRIEGLTLSLGAGANTTHAIVIAPLYFKIEGEDGQMYGASLSAWNRIQGTQHGWTIGLLNYARELHGVQIGLINISDNDSHRFVSTCHRRSPLNDGPRGRERSTGGFFGGIGMLIRLLIPRIS